MKIYFKTIEQNTGRKFDDLLDLQLYVNRSLEYLTTHNKNYNKKQYEKIIELKEIFNAIEFDLNELIN